MSIQAISWALNQVTKKSSEKFVLVALANYSNKSGVTWRSVVNLSSDTQLDIKTIYASLVELESMGFISDTGEREGRTRSVKVFQMNMEAHPKTGELEEDEACTKTGKLETDKHTQKRSTTKNGAPPKTGKLSIPKNDIKHTQKRVNDPKEPKYKPKDNIYTDFSGKLEFDFSCWPSKPSPEIFSDWKLQRKNKKSVLTQTVINRFGKEITKAEKKGYSVDECLEEVICRNWQGFSSEWLETKNKPQAVFCSPTLKPLGAL